jgi:hypothetical protein
MTKNQPLSIAAKATIFTYTFYIVAFLILQTAIIWQVMEDDTSFLRSSAESHLRAASALVADSHIVEACDYLSAAYNDSLIGFFVIQRGNNGICIEPNSKYSDLVLNYGRFGEYIKSEDFGFKAEKVNNDIVVVGNLENTAHSRLLLIKTNAGRLILAPLAVLICIWAGGLLIQVPFRRMQRRLREGEAGPASKIDFFSRLTDTQEANLANAASEASAQEIGRLKSDIKIVERTIGNSIFEEIKKNGDKTPYRFSSTFLRFDVNNYTTAYLKNPDAVQNMIAQITTVSAEIIPRYRGLQYDFAGDEFVICFKDSDSKNSRAMAVAAVRDIFEQIEALSPNKEIDQKITLKASIYHSDNYLYEIDIGFFIRGHNLIYTQRLLTTVDLKDRNLLVIAATDAPQVTAIAQSERFAIHDLKGLGPTQIGNVVGFLPIDSILQRREIDLLEFYRSDGDVLKMIVATMTPEVPYQDKMKIMTFLKGFSIHRSNIDLVAIFIKATHFFDQRSEAENERFLLSSLLAAGEKIIPREQWSETHSEYLSELKSLYDTRVASSALILLAAKGTTADYYKYEQKIIGDHIGDSFRPIGDSVIARAQFNLEESTFKTLSEMLKSKNPFECATGIYAAARIMIHYSSANIVQLSQYPEVRDLIATISELTDSENTMVSLRAKIELAQIRKAGL